MILCGYDPLTCNRDWNLIPLLLDFINISASNQSLLTLVQFY